MRFSCLNSTYLIIATQIYSFFMCKINSRDDYCVHNKYIHMYLHTRRDMTGGYSVKNNLTTFFTTYLWSFTFVKLYFGYRNFEINFDFWVTCLINGVARKTSSDISVINIIWWQTPNVIFHSSTYVSIFKFTAYDIDFLYSYVLYIYRFKSTVVSRRLIGHWVSEPRTA